MCPATSSNINRKNKGTLSSDSGGLSSLGRGERQIWILVNRIIDIIVMMIQRGFFIFEGD